MDTLAFDAKRFLRLALQSVVFYKEITKGRERETSTARKILLKSLFSCSGLICFLILIAVGRPAHASGIVQNSFSVAPTITPIVPGTGYLWTGSSSTKGIVYNLWVPTATFFDLCNYVVGPTTYVAPNGTTCYNGATLAGYFWTSMLTGNTSCPPDQIKYNNQCVQCPASYAFNSTSGMCVKTTACPSNSTGTATCTCNDGYMPDPTATSCVLACPAHASGTPCVCDDGYKFDAAGTSCILEQYTISLSGLGGIVMPNTTLKTAYAQVTTGNGTPKNGAQVNLALTVAPEEDGYNHAVGQHTAPHVGSLLPTAGTTGADGRLSFVFQAPEAGGTHTITATCINCTNQAMGTIKVPGCTVADLPPITDPEVQAFEDNPDLSDTTRLTARMGMNPGGALLCLRAAISSAGGASSVGSAYRPPAYNQHLIDAWNKWGDLLDERRPECQPLRTKIKAHFDRHGMVHEPHPSSAHTRGEAFDLTSNLPYATLDALADSCHVYRNIPNEDRIHFIHR